MGQAKQMVERSDSFTKITLASNAALLLPNQILSAGQ